MDLLDPVAWTVVVLVAALVMGLFNRCDAQRWRRIRTPMRLS